MPRVEEGYKILPVERVVREPGLIEVFTSIASNEECRCFIVDSPFIVTANVKGFIVEQVVGVGSIVCSPECTVETDVVAAAPAWGYGRYIGGRCIVAGDIPGLTLLGSIGYHIEEARFADAFDMASKADIRGIVYLPSFAGRLEVEEVSGGCGTVYSYNPLHPVGALGKPRHSVCVDRVYTLAGPLGKLVKPLLGLNKVSLFSLYQSMGELLVVGFDVEYADRLLASALWLGVMYTCGREA